MRNPPRRERGVNMQECKIRLGWEEVSEFVQKASKCDFDIDIFYNRFVIDAKSILGVLGLDFNQVLTVRYGGQNTDFNMMLKRLAVG